MGFKLPQRKANLVFEGGDFEGAEVKVTLDQPLGMLIEAQALQESNDVNGLCRFIAGILVSWNLEDKDDKPIPATEKGLHEVYPAFVDALVTAWVEAQTGVPEKKDEKSKDGPG